MPDLSILPPKLSAPLAALDDGEEQKYLDVILDRSRSAQRVSDVLTQAGFPVSATTIRDTRRKVLNV